MSRDFLGSFADSFLKSYLAQQELRQRDEQFRSKQNLDQRQFNLSQAFQEKKFEYEQQQNELAQPKEEAMTKYYESLTNKNNTPEQTISLLGDRTIGGVKGLAYGFSQNGSDVINKFVPFTRSELNQGEGYNSGTKNSSSGDGSSKVSDETIRNLRGAITGYNMVNSGVNNEGDALYTKENLLTRTENRDKYAEELLKEGGYYDHVALLDEGFKEKGISFDEGINLLQDIGYNLTRDQVRDLQLYYEAKNPSVFKLPTKDTRDNPTQSPFRF